MEQLTYIRKALDIVTFVLFCLAVFSVGFLFAPDLRPAPSPVPAPSVTPDFKDTRKRDVPRDHYVRCPTCGASVRSSDYPQHSVNCSLGQGGRNLIPYVPCGPNREPYRPRAPRK